MGDDGVGHVQHRLGAAVILFKAVDLRLGKVLREIQNIVDVRAAPRVYTLVLIAHHEQIALLAQITRDQVLAAVGVLIFIHQDIAETVPVTVAHFRKAFEEKCRQRSQIIKVQGGALSERVVVADPQLAAGFLLRAFGRVFPRGKRFRLLDAADIAQGIPGRYRYEIFGKFLDQAFHQRQLVAVVEYDEITGPFDLMRLTAQHPQAKGMKGSQERRNIVEFYAFRETPAHFTRSLVGKGKRQQAASGHPPVFHQVGHALYDNAGLAAASARQYQDGSVGRGHRRLLCFIQCDHEKRIRSPFIFR